MLLMSLSDGIEGVFFSSFDVVVMEETGVIPVVLAAAAADDDDDEGESGDGVYRRVIGAPLEP